MGIQCIASNFLRPECEDRDRDAETCNLSCQKVTTLSATRGAGLVQIANALFEHGTQSTWQKSRHLVHLSSCRSPPGVMKSQVSR